jgi:hypothetical protein
MLDPVVDDAFLGSEDYWLERMPPELECDDSDVALLVEGLVGATQMRSYT